MMQRTLAGLVVFAALAPAAAGQSLDAAKAVSAQANVERNLRADVGFLASDAMRGRGSATEDEHKAAEYVAAEFARLKLEPGGGNGTYVQASALPNPLPGRLAEHMKQFEHVPRVTTWNAVGILRGSDPKLKDEVILLTAHLDHLGLCPAVNGDTICNGADDDASGTAAVMELARVLVRARTKRTIVFACFGSEEMGSFGARAFLAAPPMPLTHVMANLEFEMIGRADPLTDGSLWLTGYERSSLGAMLAAHGAHLVADPRPEQNFFKRSDNFPLAQEGIIAHTVSSFALEPEYHTAKDEIGLIDFGFMSRAIASMIAPVEWLANTPWKPGWNKDGRP
jgi:Zn-dependent M28 family amino/carboxypeptidase